MALGSLYLQFGTQAEPELEVRGGELGEMVLLPSGGVGFRIENPRLRALHPMWWSTDRHYNYVLQIHMPMTEVRSQSLTITAVAEDMERDGR